MVAARGDAYLQHMTCTPTTSLAPSTSLARGSRLAGLAHYVALAAVLAVGVYAGTATADAQPARPTAPVSPPAASRVAANPNELVVRYLAVWNERDARKRRDLIARTWSDGGSYVDAHRRGEGHDGIDAMIKTAQDRFPGYQLRLVSGIEAHNGFVRFSWAAGGVPEAPLYLAGTDVFVVAADGRLQQVIGFVDAAPAPAR
jgi:hypothetical protein